MTIVTDHFSTTRATWDVIVSHLVQDATYRTPDKVVASFMNYQDCYVFMKGIAVANGKTFKEYHPDLVFITPNGHLEYKIAIRDVYIGKERS